MEVANERQCDLEVLYTSDQDDEMEDQNVHSKRQKMTEEERLTRCRERNKVHARNTRERKKSQMDGLQCRIQELVDQRKRLHGSTPESSVASILMSLAGSEGHNEEGMEPNLNAIAFRIGGEDDISKSIEKLKMQVSTLLGDDDKDAIDLDPLLLKDKSTCSTSELEMIRRERNRMHAKKTRLKKKKMVQEMETIITSLEKEVVDLQGNLISALPKTRNISDLPRPIPMRTVVDEANSYPSGPLAVHKRLAEAVTPIGMNSCNEVTQIRRPESVLEAPSSSSKKRKHQVYHIEGHGRHVIPLLNRVITPPTEAGSIIEAQDDRDSIYSWPQHKFKNAVKTVSICSESTGSESSGNEGDLSSGSVVHSLLHMGGQGQTSRDSSPRSRSDNDDSDTLPCYTNCPNPSPPVCSRSAPLATPACIPVPAQSFKTIQAILASCEPKVLVQSTPVNGMNTDSSCQLNYSHWRLPERSTPLHNDIVTAVASTYPLGALSENARQYQGFIPMNQSVSAPSSICQEGGNHDFPLYGSNGHNMLPLKKRLISTQEDVPIAPKNIPQELDFIEAPPSPLDYSTILSQTPLELRRIALTGGKQHSSSGGYMSSTVNNCDKLSFKTLEIMPPSL